MKVLDMFVIVILIAVAMFGLIYIGGTSTTMPAPSEIKDTFGHTSANNATNASYQLAQNVTAIETQGAGSGIIIVAACVILVIIFAFIVLSRGKYSKSKYRT